MEKLNRVCDLYASGATVKEIAYACGVSSKTIWLYLAKARDLGDVRARHRRVRRENFVKVLMDSFEAADGGYLAWTAQHHAASSLLPLHREARPFPPNQSWRGQAS